MRKIRLAVTASVGEVLREELVARKWTLGDLLCRMDCESRSDKEELGLEVGLILEVPEVRLDERLARRIAKAIGVSAEFLLNLDRAHHQPPP